MCITTSTETSGNITIQLNLPSEQPGLAIAGGDFDENGQTAIQHTGFTSCASFTLLLSATSSVDTGILLPLEVSVINTTENYCIESDSMRPVIQVLAIDCSAPQSCRCDDISGGVSLYGNQYLSNLIDNEIIDLSMLPPCLAINGVLYVDIPFFQMKSTEFRMGPAAQIIVKDMSSLVIGDSYIHGCGKLWSTIAKFDRGSLDIIRDTIEDGLTAIASFPKYIPPNIYYVPNMRISDNLFKKKFIGVYAPGSFSKTNYQVFANNEFNCENMTLAPTPVPKVLNLVPKTQSYAGVYIFGAGLSITIGPESNHFHHLQNGIIARNSNVNVYNAVFDNIPVNTEYNHGSIPWGCGIYFSTGSLYQQGTGKSSATPSFHQVNTAIKVLGPTGTVLIEQNNMTGVKTGVQIVCTTTFPTAIIRQNTIHCKQVGIDMLDMFNVHNALISENYIGVSDSLSGDFPGVSQKGATGIRHMSTYSDYPNNAGKITGNTLDIREFNYGILINSADLIDVESDTVHLLHTGAISGISFLGSTRGVLNCNRVDGAGVSYPSGRNIAFQVNNSTGTQYTCNKTDNIGIGFRFAGICDASPDGLNQTDFRGNYMETEARGLWMQDDAILGSMTDDNEMVHRGNLWLESFTEHRAIHEGSIDQLYYSRFKVHTNNLPYYPRSNDTLNPSPATPNAMGFVWFKVSNDGNPYTCSGQECMRTPTSEPTPTYISSLGLAIAADSLTLTSGYEEAINWTLSRHLFQVLDDYPDLLSQDASLQQFYSTQSASPAGAFTAIDRLIGQANQGDSLDHAQLEVWESDILSRRDSVDTLIALLEQDTSESGQAQLNQALANVLLEIDSLRKLQTGLSLDMFTAKLSLIDSAEVLNAAVTSALDIEANERAVNAVYFAKTARGDFSLTESETDTLAAIAYQCPTLGGATAVFRARSILTACGYDENFYDDDSLCLASVPRSQPARRYTFTSEKRLQIIPNPVRDHALLKITGKPERAAGEIVISDMLGKQWVDMPCPGANGQDGVYAIPVFTLPSGLFSVQVYFDGKLFGTTKFIVLN